MSVFSSLHPVPLVKGRKMVNLDWSELFEGHSSPGYGNEILLNHKICFAEVNKQCQAAHISGSVRLMNHLALRQTLKPEDETRETLSRVIPSPQRAQNLKSGRFRRRRAQWMQVAGLKHTPSPHLSLCIQTQYLLASQMMLESINADSVPDSFVTFCV